MSSVDPWAGPLIQDEKKDTRLFETGATRDVDSSKLDYEGFISPAVLRRYAEYMHECRLRNIPPGETIRASDNWQKGIPREAYMKSLIRHTIEVWEQWDGETSGGDKVSQTTLCAILFNVQGLLFEMLKEDERNS